MRADYITLEQMGTEWLTPSYPELLCQMASVICELFVSLVMKPVTHAGSESIDRKMSNSLDTHIFKVGLNDVHPDFGPRRTGIFRFNPPFGGIDANFTG